MSTDAALPLPLRIARALGLGRGLFKRDAVGHRPQELLELYSYEGCPMCRRVRQTLTELDIDYVHRSCPRGDSENRRRLEARGGKVQVPYLVDPNHGVEMYESGEIIRHLVHAYGAAS
jgi:glutaredoxin